MSVAKSSFLFAGGTLISRVAGLVRDIVVVGVFGASSLLDAFLVAFRIPNLLREMLAEGALGSAFTKVYSAVSAEDPRRASRLLADGLYLSFLVSLVVCGIGILISPQLVEWMTLMVDDSERVAFVHNATGLTRLLFPYLGLTIMGSVVMGALHQKGRFFLSAIAPVAFNLGYVLGAWGLARWFEAWSPDWMERFLADPMAVGLAVGVLLGGLGHFLWQLWGVWDGLRSEDFHFLRIPWSPELKNVVTIMLPATVAASSGPINLFINTNFATSVGPGAVSWLNYAFRLLQLPIGIFGVAVGAAVLPPLARAITQAGKQVNAAVSGQFQAACELVVWLMVPCMVFLLANSLPVIDLLFRHGHFTDVDAEQTAAALYAYSFGILGYGLIKVLTSFYYAVERTTYAMRVSVFSVATNALGNYLLVKPFGHIGLALTSSVTLSLNAVILLLGLARHKMAFKWNDILKTLVLLVMGGLLCYVVQRLCLNGLLALDFGGSVGLKLRAAATVVANGGITVAVFGICACLRLGKSPREAWQELGKRRRKTVTPNDSKSSRAAVESER